MTTLTSIAAGVPAMPTLPANPTPAQTAEFAAEIEIWAAEYGAITSAIKTAGDAMVTATTHEPQAL